MKRRTGWLPRREERGVVQGDAQHGQLQARDLAGHLRRHARVGEDLVEQAADDVDHHVIELAGGGLHQLLAVRPDEVDRHQVGQAVRSAVGSAAGRVPVRRGHAGADEVAGGAGTAGAGHRAVRAAVSARARCRVEFAGAAGDGREAPQQRHQLGVGRRRCAADIGEVAGGVPAGTRARRPRHGAGVHRGVVTARAAAGGRRRRLSSGGGERSSMLVHQLAVADRSQIGAAAARQRRQVGIARIEARDLVARAFHGAHLQAHRLDAAPLQPDDDLRIALGHRLCHRLAEVAGEDAARIGIVGNRLDSPVERGAEDVAAQRVAVFVGAAAAGDRSHVRGQVAQLPFAFVRDQLADALVVHALLDLAVVDQAERLPVGRGGLGLGLETRFELVPDLVLQRVVERALEAAEVAAQILLRGKDRHPFGAAAGRRRELLAHASRHRGDGGPELDHGRFHRSLQARFRTSHLWRRSRRCVGEPSGERRRGHAPASIA